MNPKLLLVLAIVFILVVPDTDAWFGGRRRRRFSIPIPKWVCNTVCTTTCTYKTGRGFVCALACPKVCKWLNGKRDEPDRPALAETVSTITTCPNHLKWI